MNTEILRSETTHYRALQDQLRQDYANIDDETLTDTLEGASSLPDIIAEIVRSALEDDTMIGALKARCDAMTARLSRLKERHEKKRKLVAWAMGTAGLPKIKESDFSVSLLAGVMRLEVTNEALIAPSFFVPLPPKLDRAALSAALKRGEAVDGAQMAQGQPFITVSTK